MTIGRVMRAAVTIASDGCGMVVWLVGSTKEEQQQSKRQVGRDQAKILINTDKTQINTDKHR